MNSNGNIIKIDTNSSYLFAATFGGGIYKSSDNGINWSVSNTGLSSLAIRSFAINGSNIFAGTDGNGIFLSTNNGSDWVEVNNGLNNYHILSIAIDSSNVYISTFNGIYFSSNNGSSWKYLGLMGECVTSLSIFDKYIFAGTTEGLCISSDNFHSWSTSQIGNLFTSYIDYLLVQDSSVYVGTHGNGVWKRSLSEIIISKNIINDIVKIYPNPIYSKVIIESSPNSLVEFYDIQCKLVRSYYFIDTQNIVDISDLLSGVYIVRIYSKEKVYFKKIVKF